MRFLFLTNVVLCCTVASATSNVARWEEIDNMSTTDRFTAMSNWTPEDRAKYTAWKTKKGDAAATDAPSPGRIVDPSPRVPSPPQTTEGSAGIVRPIAITADTPDPSHGPRALSPRHSQAEYTPGERPSSSRSRNRVELEESASENIEPGEQTWECGVCTFVNKAVTSRKTTRYHCKMCRSPKPDFNCDNPEERKQAEDTVKTFETIDRIYEKELAKAQARIDKDRETHRSNPAFQRFEKTVSVRRKEHAQVQKQKSWWSALLCRSSRRRRLVPAARLARAENQSEQLSS